MSVGEDVTGLLVESHEGRPTKVEGNPSIPRAWGPVRQGIRRGCSTSTIPTGFAAGSTTGSPTTPRVCFKSSMNCAPNSATGGEGGALLLPTIASPSILRALDLVRASLPKIALHRYEPLTLDAMYAATKAAFGRAKSCPCPITGRPTCFSPATPISSGAIRAPSPIPAHSRRDAIRTTRGA